MVEQLLLNSRVRHTHPRRFNLGVDVVQKNEDFFGWVQPSLSGQQSWVLSQSEQQWHKRVALLTPFALSDAVGHSTLVFPEV